MIKITRSLCLLLVGGLFAVGCAEDFTSVGSSDPSFGVKPGGGGGSTTPADPALTYVGSTTVKGKTYSTLYVMDVDGTHLTNIYRVPSSTMVLYSSPTWSADGSSIVFTQSGNGTSNPDTIKAIDVSVNTSGQVVTSNIRTISVAPSGVKYKNPFWCSSDVGQIAFTSDETGTNSLWTVSTAGGSPTLITSVDKSWTGSANPLGTPTWNGDDSRLAMIRIGSNNTTIMIFSTSTWEYIDSITVAGTISGLEWSRAGSTNALAYGVSGKLYYVEPTTGAIPTTNNAVGNFPAWAPDNSSLMLVSGTNLYNNTAHTSSSSLVTSVPSASVVKWK
jgi:hypothetical protein